MSVHSAPFPEPLALAQRIDARDTTSSSQLINYIVFQLQEFITIHYSRMWLHLLLLLRVRVRACVRMCVCVSVCVRA